MFTIVVPCSDKMYDERMEKGRSTFEKAYPFAEYPV